MYRQSRITDASQLEFRVIHCCDMTGWFGCCSTMAINIGGHAMTALTER
jgi:hypothetical protein